MHDEMEKGSMCADTPFFHFTIVQEVSVTSFNAIFLLNKLPNLIRISTIYSSCERAQRDDHFGTNISKFLFLSLTSFFQNTAVYEKCNLYVGMEYDNIFDINMCNMCVLLDTTKPYFSSNERKHITIHYIQLMR